MHPLTNLPVLNALYTAAIKSALPSMENTAFICVQHLLDTSVDLFRTLLHLGAKPNNIFLIGKHYSTSSLVVNQLQAMKIYVHPLTPLKKLGEYGAIIQADIDLMLEKAKYHIMSHSIENIIVLDDGGRCLEFLHHIFFTRLPTIGIEQTTAGIFNQLTLDLAIPFIDVATCAAKRHLESEMIARTIVTKTQSKISLLDKKAIYGVIGTGTIGTELAKKLIMKGCNIVLYDKNRNENIGLENGLYCHSVEELIKKSKYIFGCTGRDSLKDVSILDLIEGEKTFLSCSSEDKEFLSLLTFIQQTTPDNHRDPLADITYPIPGKGSLTFIKGGFPVNFDHTGGSVPPLNIQLTRGLLLSAIIQSLILIADPNKKKFAGRMMLHPTLQNFVVQNWFNHDPSFPHLESFIQRFFHSNWVAHHSGGVFYDTHHLNSFIYQKDTLIHSETIFG
jgi:hypothetical protein